MTDMGLTGLSTCHEEVIVQQFLPSKASTAHVRRGNPSLSSAEQLPFRADACKEP